MTSSQPSVTSSSAEAVMLEIQNQLRTRAESNAVIGPETNITRDLGLDSLAIMDFIFDLEDSFDISIPMERIAEVQTLADLAGVIKMLQKEVA